MSIVFSTDSSLLTLLSIAHRLSDALMVGGTGCDLEKGTPECAGVGSMVVAAAIGDHVGSDSAGGVGVTALGWEQVRGTGPCGVVVPPDPAGVVLRWGGRGRHRPMGWVVVAAAHDRSQGLVLMFSIPE